MRRSKITCVIACLLTPALSTYGIGNSITVDVSGLVSFDDLGAPGNDVLLIDLAPNSELGTTVTGIYWDLNITAFDASWVSEVAIAATNTDQTSGLTLGTGGRSDPNNNEEINVQGGGKFVDLNFNPPFVNFDVPDGIVRLEIFESFDDVDGVADAMIGPFSTVTIQFGLIPAPGAIALFALAGICRTSCRRRA